MPRNKCKRQIEYHPKMSGFAPFGIYGAINSIELFFEEYESIRLMDYIGLSQEEAAQRMAVSRPTVTRIYEQARRKVAEAFIEGKAINISGGNYSFSANWCKCNKCHLVYQDNEPELNIKSCHCDS